MIVALDTNILVYAHREEAEHHQAAKRLVARYADGDAPWALAWPCLYEFLRVVTHPRVFHPPTRQTVAWQAVESLLDSPSLMLLTETQTHRHLLGDIVASASLAGNLFHDAHIAALLSEHGIHEILTTDEDFRRFAGLKVTHPFR